jgi:hypothetical protein
MAAFVVVRWALVSLTVGAFVTNLLVGLPLSSDLSAWYTGNALLILGMIVALGAWALYTSIGTKRRMASSA